ncbi:LysR family transcriptional regulator [Alginatibacterium sediminis]|uniref:LysR family transcriptional regulator n=1 Tax=Alginatibacterium sediminis TaxID=2164068 RepID=A0A420END5_9ALTE|nr:LysR family transcriptional regulator [Alginatibacterium sediminis]RKF22178.1 LysR family transcriptional regulator [Alginatibacterium sediminis]
MRTIEQQLSRMDLNLLVSLSVLIKEKNVSRAAQILYISQPAMSRTLARLRDLFNDPLFYRESNGLIPTQKTLSLEAPLDVLLQSMQQLVTQISFKPEHCDTTFLLSLPPLMSQLLSVPLAKQLMNQAPQASLVEYPTAKDPTRQLSERIVDFTIHVQMPNNLKEFPTHIIGETFPVFYGSTDHPLLSIKNPCIEDCLNFRFVDLSLDIRSNEGIQNPIDLYLNQRGLHRDIAYRSGQLSSLVEVMQDSNSILVSSHHLANLPRFKQSIRPVLRLGDIEELITPIYLIEHKRSADSQAHQWFGALIKSTLKDLISHPRN